MHTVFLLICLVACFDPLNAQKTLSTGNASVKFVSARNSDVSAVNNKVNVTINEAGDISFRLLIREFKFEMAEMEAHFNKEYLESDKYPNASFKGKLPGFRKIDLTKAGLYKVQAEGEMSIHNVTRRIIVSGTLQIDKNAVILQANFSININDYKIDTGLGGVIIGSKMNIDVTAKCQ